MSMLSSLQVSQLIINYNLQMSIFLTEQQSFIKQASERFHNRKQRTQKISNKQPTTTRNDSRIYSPTKRVSSEKQYHFFPNLNKYYYDQQNQRECSLNQIIDTQNTIILDNSRLETSFQLNKIRSESSNKFVQVYQKQKVKSNTPINLSPCFSKIDNSEKLRHSLLHKIKKKNHSPQKNNDTPPLGFYNIQSLERFKFPKPKTAIIPKPLPLPQNPIRMRTLPLSPFSKIPPPKSINSSLFPSKIKYQIQKYNTLLLNKKQKSLRLIQNFYDGHHKFNNLYHQIRKK